MDVRDHYGKRYKSVAEMARAWGKAPSTVKSRLARGLPVRYALETPTKSGRNTTYTQAEVTVTYGGVEYVNMDALATAYGLGAGLNNSGRAAKPGILLERRMEEGVTARIALDNQAFRKYIAQNVSVTQEVFAMTAPSGMKFSSEKELKDYYGL